MNRLKIIIGFFNPKSKRGAYPLGVVLSCFLLLTYCQYIHFVKNTDQQLFNIDDTYSWRETQDGIRRIDARGNIDTLLISKDTWTDFDFSFTLINPRDCGIFYNLQDNNNFFFIYFNAASQSLAWGMSRDGRPSVVNLVKTDIPPRLSGHLNVKGRLAQLYLNEQLHSQINLPFNKGKIGFILPDARIPPTLFQKISIEGHTDRGEFKSSQGTVNSFQQKLRAIIAITLFYLAMLVMSIYLAQLLRANIETGSHSSVSRPFRFRSFTAAIVHLAITIILFWPFVFKGSVFVSSMDNYGEIFPLFFLSKHNFTSILRGESLCLWNPYTHNGLPFFSNHWNMIYYPLNWFIFFVPDQNVMSALTLRTFIEVFLIGILAYGFFVRELSSRTWALYCSIVYQMCSLLIFTLSIFPSISLYFAMTAYLYCLWSMPQRRMVWNYVLLSLSVFLILTSANVAFIFYAGASLIIFTIYRLWTVPSSILEKKRNTVTVLSSVVTGILLSTVRVIPCILGILNSNRLVDNYYTLHDRMAMVVRLFLPEIVGWLRADLFNALTSKNLNLIYEQSDLPSNSQNTFLVYFGVIAALLLLLNVFIRTKGRHTFWKIYAFVTIAIALLFQPFWGILSILFFPLNHYSYHTIILPVGICALLGYTGQALEENRVYFTKIGNPLIAGLLIIQSLILVIVTYLFPQLTSYTRLIFMLMMTWFGVYLWINRHRHHLRQSYLTMSTAVLIGILWVGLFFISTVLFMRPIPAKEEATELLFIPYLIVLAVTLTAIYMSICLRTGKNLIRERRVLFTIFLISPLIMVYGLIHSPLFNLFVKLNAPHRAYFMDVTLGELKFLFITFIFSTMAVLYKVRWVSAQMLLKLILGITVLDLWTFNARFENVVAPSPINSPYYSVPFPYPKINNGVFKTLDLLNYRCDSLDKAGFNSNKSLIYSIPSYTGIIGYMPKRFYNFIRQFDYPKDTVLIYPEDSTNDDRFLDLSAVKYKFKSESEVMVRPTALSRLMLFYSYEIIEEDYKLLASLKSESFNPWEKVLLSTNPKQENILRGTRKTEFISIERATTDVVSTHITNDEPAVLLFNESYDKGWKAYVDGHPVAIYPANYNFMACLLRAGSHTIQFKYEPYSFYLSLFLSRLGLVLLAAFSIFLILRERKKFR